MYLYTLKQEVAGIGTVIVVSANFMANNGIITLNFYTRESEFDKYRKTLLSFIKSLKIEETYIHQYSKKSTMSINIYGRNKCG